MQEQSIVISSSAIKNALTELITTYITIVTDRHMSRMEKDLKSYYIRGQIDAIAALLSINQCDDTYYRYLVDLVETYSLSVDISPLLTLMNKRRRSIRAK